VEAGQAPGVPRQGISSPRQGISGSTTRNIRFPTGGYNLSNSKIIVLYVQLMLTNENVEFVGSEMVQNLLSITVIYKTWSLQNISNTKHGHYKT
jgi:hypothetical protein